MGSDYIAIALAILAGVGMACLLSFVAGRGTPRLTKGKQISYEAGSDPIGTPRARFSVKFYQVAIMFLVFDIEAAFLYPWAVNYRALSCEGSVVNGVCTGAMSLFGLADVVVFMGVLVVGLAYVWRKRAIGWE